MAKQPTIEISQELKQMMNDAIALEMGVSIQYMLQHVQVVGVKGIAVEDRFRSTAIAEMQHAERIAERLWYFNEPIAKTPAPVVVGNTLAEYLAIDAQAEKVTIELYRKIIAQAEQEGDTTTAFLFRDILEDEEAHHDLFITMLEEV